MDRNKSGLKGNGIVMPGNFNTGDPSKLISPLPYLKKTILDLHGAKNHLTNMINGGLNGPGHLNATDLATLEATIKAIDSGLGYLDTLEGVLKGTGIIDARS